MPDHPSVKSMSNTDLFNHKTKAIPEIRRDIEIIPVSDNGRSLLYFHDVFGYATADLALHRQAAPLLNLIDGEKSVNDLMDYSGEEVTADQLLEYVRFLDEHRLLDSPYFRKYAEKVEEEYEHSDLHQPVAAGASYPADPEELEGFLKAAFSKVSAAPVRRARALFAPHIDPRVALDSYAEAFASIRNLEPRRVVILATSHYASHYPELYRNRPFILSNKDINMPFGRIAADREAIEPLLKDKSVNGLTGMDRAHRIEHSIELHLLFLSYIWDHPFKVVPILVGNLDDLYYMPEGHRGKQVDNFSRLLNDHFADDRDTFFLISGDLAHIGKKFGDSRPARQMFDEIKSFDRLFMKHAREGVEEEMLTLMRQDYDPYRVCGFPPLYTFLKCMDGVSGHSINYDIWDEEERESAVSFGSILYTEGNRSPSDIS